MSPKTLFYGFPDKHRGLVLRGITTDASALYPEPISKVFGDVPHQVCEFHVIKELTKAVLRAVAKVRKELAATKPKLGRGRPSSAAARQAARRRKRQVVMRPGPLTLWLKLIAPGLVDRLTISRFLRPAVKRTLGDKQM